MTLGVGIVGAGRIGARRAEVLSRVSGARLVAVADADAGRAEALARAFGSRAYAEPEAVFGARDVQAVIVATPHQWLAPITKAALDAGKHVLCEKPLARSPEEAAMLVAAAAHSKRALKTGFNHRYHPAIAEGHRLVIEGRIGRLLVLRCRYGHGGRTGYEHEWRADRISGGGELLDQGVHALDLFRWFAGEFTEVSAMISSAFWPIEVEDNAFCLLRSAEGITASLHASWTQWKNLFSFEVFGDRGYVLIEGLGGSYGPERLVIGERHAGEAPSEQQIEFSGEDTSWAAEWAEFAAAIREERAPEASGLDGWQALRLAAAAYESARTKTVVRIDS
ncbi:MAG: Gfo/Idh/MocA family oxidoreductase [Candidatus Acidiferrales bacterium]